MQHHDRNDLGPRAIVIGAGAAGLATAACLQRRGVPVTVLERGERVGWAWQTAPTNLRLDSVRWASGLPGARIPRRAGSWVTREAFADHLDRYVRKNRLAVRTGVEAQRVRLAHGFVVDTDAGPVRSSWVVVATGAERDPQWPDWPGRAAFGGTIIHSSAYRCADPYRGREVLVVGEGSTAAGIAEDLAAGGVRRVRLAVGSPPQIVPRRIAGVSSTAIAVALQRFPGAADRVLAAGRRRTFGDLAPHGLPEPADPLSSAFARTGVAPIVDAGFVDAVRGGAIEVVPGVADVDRQGVRLADGTQIRPDVVIAATGHRPGLEPLVGHLGVLDAGGAPIATGSRSHPFAPGLHFVGFHPPAIASLRAIRVEATELAAAIEPADPYDDRWWIRPAPAPSLDLTRTEARA